MFPFNVLVQFVRHGSLVLELALAASERPRASDRSPSSSKLCNARHLDLVVVDFLTFPRAEMILVLVLVLGGSYRRIKMTISNGNTRHKTVAILLTFVSLCLSSFSMMS